MKTLRVGLIAMVVCATLAAPVAAFFNDRENAVEPIGVDVYVSAGGVLKNPVGHCQVEPCGVFETLPSAALFSVVGIPLGLTWGEWQNADGTSRVRCLDDGSTEVRVRLRGLIPGGVYSLFYRTFGPDSRNPLCPTEERSLVVADVCNGRDCPTAPDSLAIAGPRGRALFRGRVDGTCLLDATQVFLDVVYHFDGNTWGALPNHLEFLTQVQPCQGSTDCESGDECVENVCQPPNCTADNSCRICHGSFGRDAMRQAAVVQK